MPQTLRPYATAGVAVVGASLIAATPMAPRLPDIQLRDVALTAGEADLLAPWESVFNTASENATTLLNNFSLAPAVGLQQALVDMSDYTQQLLDNPANITTVTADLQENLRALLTGPMLINAPSDVVTAVTNHTLDGAGLNFDGVEGHLFLFQEIGSFLPSNVNPAEVTPIIDFLSSPISGVIMGELGPDISPWIALANSISAGDSFNETLANMVGAYFNGADLSLNSLIPAIEQAGIFPTGMNIENIDIAFGGLLTPGEVAIGPYNDTIPAVGGSILNSVGIHLTGVPILGQLEIASQAVGPIGAMEGLDQTIGDLLGSGWDGKGPVDVTAPLTGITLPTIPAEVLDSGTAAASAAGDLSTLVQDILSAF